MTLGHALSPINGTASKPGVGSQRRWLSPCLVRGCDVQTSTRLHNHHTAHGGKWVSLSCIWANYIRNHHQFYHMDSVSTGNRMVYAYPPLNTTHSLLQIITTVVSSIIHDEHGFILMYLCSSSACPGAMHSYVHRRYVKNKRLGGGVPSFGAILIWLVVWAPVKVRFSTWDKCTPQNMYILSGGFHLQLSHMWFPNGYCQKLGADGYRGFFDLTRPSVLLSNCTTWMDWGSDQSWRG